MELTAKEISDKVIEKHHFVFRNDCGIAKINDKTIRYGLYPGSGDFIGWSTVEITKEMIGKKIAVFTSIEVKTVNDRLRKNQKDWIRNVKAAGGIAEVWKARKNGDIKIE